MSGCRARADADYRRLTHTLVSLVRANLSSDYFTNRQDRYVHIRNHHLLSNYLHSLLLLTSRFSYNLKASAAASSSLTHHAAYDLNWDDGSDLLLSEDEDGNVTEEASLSTAPKESKEYAFAEGAGVALKEFTDRWRIHTDAAKRRRAQAGPADDEVDTFIVPVLQMGPMAIRQETDMMPLLFEAIEQQEAPIQETLPSAIKKGRLPAPKATIDFTSGYFSLHPLYKSLILNSPASIRTRIITAAPISNGFFGSKGISRHLPPAYTWLENKFWDAVKRQGKKRSVEIREWEKEGWTYHAKGEYTAAVHEANPIESDFSILLKHRCLAYKLDSIFAHVDPPWFLQFWLTLSPARP